MRTGGDETLNARLGATKRTKKRVSANLNAQKEKTGHRRAMRTQKRVNGRETSSSLDDLKEKGTGRGMKARKGKELHAPRAAAMT